MDYKNSYEVPTFNETNLKIGYTLNMSGTKVAAIVHANNTQVSHPGGHGRELII